MFSYLFFRSLVLFFSFLPYSWVYRIADFLAFVLRRVVGYRRNVIYDQLTKSFPEKSAEDIEKIARDSYQNLADILVESIKGMSQSREEFLKRYIFRNPVVSEKYTTAGRPVVHAAAHYTNWEWGAVSYPLWFSSPVYGFYKPLKNKRMESYGRRLRGIFGINLIPIKQTSGVFDENGDNPAVYVFVADQSTYSQNAHWVDFLGQDTACPQGVGKYGHRLNCPVIYVEMNRVRHGFYEIHLVELLPDHHHMAPEKITEKYMNHLESIIRRAPENWLWSHKRWKKKRQQNTV